MDQISDGAKWFLHLSGNVQGPFDQKTLQVTLQNLGNEKSEQALVWKRGLTEWVKAKNWQNAAPEPASAHNDNTQAQEAEGNSLFEKTFTQTYTEGVFFKVQINFLDQPLMTKSELMTLISKQSDVSKVSIQDPKSKAWKDVYAFPDIVERLGLSRRKNPRVPILANFSGKTTSHENISYRVITISEGGMGFTECFDLKIGDEVEGQVSSPHFFQPLNAKADVIYAGADGYIGLKFSQIPDEAKAAIIDYIKKFGKDSANAPPR
ncbi:MAG: PilZ domain-containing protein [Bdellovibrionota bacterium]